MIDLAQPFDNRSAVSAFQNEAVAAGQQHVVDFRMLGDILQAGVTSVTASFTSLRNSRLRKQYRQYAPHTSDTISNAVVLYLCWHPGTT